MAHIHAEFMKQYAEDAAETDEPWRRWEHWEKVNGRWFSLHGHPSWHETKRYRRKPRTININGHEVPEPLRQALVRGASYYVPNVFSEGRADQMVWTGDDFDLRSLKRGLVHLNRAAAKAHAQALLSFTEVEG